MKILITIAGWYDFHWSILQRCYELIIPNNCTKEIIVTTGHHAGFCRNKAVDYAIKNKFDLIYFCDGDNLPEKDVILKLYDSMINNNADIITGIYQCEHNDEKLNFSYIADVPFNLDINHISSNWCMSRKNLKLDTFQISSCGFGCVLSKVDVFKRIEKPWFLYTNKYTEDIYFCIKLMKAKIKFFADGLVYVQHFKRILI